VGRAAGLDAIPLTEENVGGGAGGGGSVKLLDRYIMRQFTTTFVMLVLGLPLLFTITDITDRLDRYLARGVPLGQVAISYIYSLPQFVFWSMPIAALIATVFTIGNMTRHQEIDAAKAGGVSFFRLLRPILVLATLLSVAAVGLGELIPVTNRMRAETLGERQAQLSTMRTNFVYQTSEGRVLASRRLDVQNNEMVNVVLERDGSEKRPATHATAALARYEDGSGWKMEAGQMRVLEGNGVEHSFGFASMQIPHMRETPRDLLADPKNPEEMRYAEMTRSIDAVERSGGTGLDLRVERSTRVALPLAILVIVLFGAPLSTSSKRGGAAFGIGISLAVTMVYLMLFKVGTAVGSSGALHPVAATWMPNVIFLLAGVFLLARVRT
jgi:lipopolysaccharide export system permease protein